MTLLASMPRIEEHRVTVVFDCPKCGAPSVRGTAYNLRETIRVSDRVPKNWGWSSHWVRCSACRAELHAECESKAFQGASSATVSDRVHPYLPFPKRFLAVAGLAIGWAPVVGVIVSIAAVVMNARSRGWPRILSIVALVLGLIYNVALFGSLIYLTMLTGRPLPMQ